jgi:predicted nuclease of predicted toxin-antitoxin system
VRFLLDANLSPKLVTALTAAGHASRHVDEIGLPSASDATIFDRAAVDGDVLITADSDFTNLLAARGSSAPSVVLLRHAAELPWREHEALLVANRAAVLPDSQEGAVVSLSPTRSAVRRLPIEGGSSTSTTPAAQDG